MQHYESNLILRIKKRGTQDIALNSTRAYSITVCKKDNLRKSVFLPDLVKTPILQQSRTRITVNPGEHRDAADLLKIL